MLTHGPTKWSARNPRMNSRAIRRTRHNSHERGCGPSRKARSSRCGAASGTLADPGDGATGDDSTDMDTLFVVLWRGGNLSIDGAGGHTVTHKALTLGFYPPPLRKTHDTP